MLIIVLQTGVYCSNYETFAAGTLGKCVRVVEMDPVCSELYLHLTTYYNEKSITKVVYLWRGLGWLIICIIPERTNL